MGKKRERETVCEARSEAATSQVRSPRASGRHVGGLRSSPEPRVLATAPYSVPSSLRGEWETEHPHHSGRPLLRAHHRYVKSPHMLPRVPVSQRHSRVLFRSLVTRYGSPGGQEGAIKRSFSLFPSLPLESTRESRRERDTHVTAEHRAHRYREAEGRCVCIVCVCVCTLRVRVRARPVPFSVPRAEPPPRPRRRIATFTEGRRAVNRVE